MYSFDGVVVITSALHAEGREFDPRSKYIYFFSSHEGLIFSKLIEIQNYGQVSNFDYNMRVSHENFLLEKSALFEIFQYLYFRQEGLLMIFGI
jgi:hypothetical protein